MLHSVLHYVKINHRLKERRKSVTFMAVSKYKKRVMITLPEKQAEWLASFTKSRGITPSKYISWLLYYKADEMLRLLKVDETNIYTEEELREIAQAKWIDN